MNKEELIKKVQDILDNDRTSFIHLMNHDRKRIANKIVDELFIK